MAALAKSSMVFFMEMALVGICYGAEYIVGDSHGWTSEGHFNYKAWSRYKHFVVGDYIVFKYEANKQDVIQVEAKHFKKCRTKHPMVTFHSSNDHDVHIQLNATGDFFFTSSISGHCDAGQKLHITVFPSNSGPSPPASSPSPSDSSTKHASSHRSSSSHSASQRPSPKRAPSHNHKPRHPPKHKPKRPPNEKPSLNDTPGNNPHPNQDPSNRRRPSPGPSHPTQPPQSAVVHKNSQAPSIHSSNGLPIMQVLMAVAVLAYIA